MGSRFLLCVAACGLIVAGTGCGVKSRFYAVDRPRVDQANMGNAGYIGGDKKDGGSIAERSTRRIYVFEFDKKKKPEVAKDSNKAVEVSSSQTASDTTESAKPSEKGISLPYIGDDEPTVDANVTKEAPANAVGMSYTVVKDDTLQKIAKKVYGSYGKWTKIYDANKDKIKNPNFVKPGTVIVIPSAN